MKKFNQIALTMIIITLILSGRGEKSTPIGKESTVSPTSTPDTTPTQTPDLSATPASTTPTDGQSIILSDDALLRLLFPYISDAIKNYYGKDKLFMDAKILEVTRLKSAQYYFRIKLQVTTFEGAHNPPYGIETITIVLDAKIRVTQFEHKDGSLKIPSSNATH